MDFKEDLHHIFLLIIFLIIHLSVNTTISHIFFMIFCKYFFLFFSFFFFFLKKECLNTKLKTGKELLNKVEAEVKT